MKKFSYNVELMQRDAAGLGYNGTSLARRARVSQMAVSKFLREQSRSPALAHKLAKALGHTVDRYLIADADLVARRQ